MSTHKTLLVIVGIVIIGAAWLLLSPSGEKRGPAAYASEKYGLSFSYPQNYAVFENTYTGERLQHSVVLFEDTPANREILFGTNKGTEGPPTITITIFQNNLDNYTLQSFVEGTNFSNFKLSDGNKTEITVGGEKAWRYRATGLYENDNVVVVRPDYVYMFTVFYNSPTDAMLADFDPILSTVQFSDVTPTDTGPTGTKKVVVDCLPEQRNADACAEIYQPVCATVRIQCITTPCEPVQETFPNSCNACRNPLVPSYVSGECVKQ